jgi:hypothetical protein
MAIKLKNIFNKKIDISSACIINQYNLTFSDQLSIINAQVKDQYQVEDGARDQV